MRRLLLGLAILLAAFVAVLLLRGRARLHASDLAAPSASAAAAPPGCARRGPVHIEAASEAEQDAIGEAFDQRNDGGWGAITASKREHQRPPWRKVQARVDPLGRLVEHSKRQRDPTPLSAPLRSHEEAKARGVEFVRRNADLLGLKGIDLEQLEISVRGNGQVGSRWDVDLRGNLPRPGYEAFRAVDRYFRIQLALREDGSPRSVMAGPLLPPFDLCVAPLLPSDDPRLLHEIIGRELFFSPLHGGRASAGHVKAEDIEGPAELTIHVQKTPERATLTLAYQWKVIRGGLRFLLLVDADTGAFLEARPLFVT